MHQISSDRPRYTGAGVYPMMPHPPHGHAHHHHHHHHPALHGFCHACCHPRVMGRCHCRECRKEAKELLVQPTTSQEDLRKDPQTLATFRRMASFAPFMASVMEEVEPQSESEASEHAPHVARLTHLTTIAADVQGGLGQAFIGGGCCVHLSVEYTPSTPTGDSVVMIAVQDSEGTYMSWARKEKAGVGYQIKEGVITTKPGADLNVIVANMTARVRWCEVFSC